MEEQSKKQKRKKSSLYYVLLKLNIISVFVLALVIIISSAKTFSDSMHEEVKTGLVDLSTTIVTLYDRMYPGGFTTVVQEDGLYLLKGGVQLNGDFELIDEIKEKFPDANCVAINVFPSKKQIENVCFENVFFENWLFENSKLGSLIFLIKIERI